MCFDFRIVRQYVTVQMMENRNLTKGISACITMQNPFWTWRKTNIKTHQKACGEEQVKQNEGGRERTEREGNIKIDQTVILNNSLINECKYYVKY